MVEVSVVVPSRIGRAELGAQLDALAAQTYTGSWELIVVVGNAPVASSAALHERERSFPALTVIERPEPLNAAAARNIGAAKARGSKLLFCDDDDVVDRNWIRALAGALNSNPAAAGRREVHSLNPDWVVASRAPAQQDGLQRWDNPPWLQHAGGGNLGVLHAVFDEVGGFDERLDALEDTAFCFVLQLRGHSIAYVHDAVVHVRMRTTLRDIYRQARSWAAASVRLHAILAPDMPRPAWVRGAVAWLALPLKLLAIRDRAGLAAWTFKLGWRVGRLRGSIRHRLPAF